MKRYISKFSSLWKPNTPSAVGSENSIANIVVHVSGVVFRLMAEIVCLLNPIFHRVLFGKMPYFFLNAGSLSTMC